MSNELINQMIAAVEDGYTPRSVWETSLTYAPGSTAKVNKATTGKDPETGAAVSVPEGEIVSIIGVGGGDTGNDHHVLLKDGRQAFISYYDLGESTLRKDSVDENDLVGIVSKVTLSKPLPQSAIDWMSGGYLDYGVELPHTPQADSSTSTTFLMKAEDQEMLDGALEALKKVAGASYKSAAVSSLTDWAKV